MPTCREVARSYSSGELDSAPWYRRLACWLHLVRCPPCRDYRDQLGLIAEEARRGAAEPDADRLAEIEEEILRELE